MESKHLVTIEFRYITISKHDFEETDHVSKTITIGVFDTFEAACIKGNKLLHNLESKYKIHVFPKGNKASKERFSLNGGCFGGKKNLITNLGYLKTPFDFYAQIKELKYQDINTAILNIENDINND